MKCYVWSVALCGAENLALRKVNQKYFEFFIRERKKDGEQTESSCEK